MTWLRLDDQFAEHEKVADLTDRAFRLHVAALCYCARNSTDGMLNERAIRIVSAILSRGTLKRQIGELVDAGLWRDRGDGGFEVNDYLDYNPSAEKVKQQRDQTRDRVRRYRASSNAPGNAVTDGVSNGTPSRPVPKRSSAVRSLIDESLRGAA